MAGEKYDGTILDQGVGNLEVGLSDLVNVAREQAEHSLRMKGKAVERYIVGHPREVAVAFTMTLFFLNLVLTKGVSAQGKEATPFVDKFLTPPDSPLGPMPTPVLPGSGGPQC